jgi:hypothetical protein
MKAWKLDLWIALAALVVSGLTASAALYQSKVFSDQLSATVWPYLSFDTTAGPSTFALTLENDGAGPAIIDSAQVFVDGKPLPSMPSALLQLAAKLPHRGTFKYATSSIGPGQVIRAGASALIVKLTTRDLARLATAYHRMTMNVYYCSLLNRCWVVKLHTSERPADVTGQNYPHAAIQ